MKVRLGFVSNSSSSSFVCDVCGEEYSGWDACLSEPEMYCCEYGHTFCEGHMKENLEDLSIEKKREYCVRFCYGEGQKNYFKYEADNEEIEDYFDDEVMRGDFRYELPSLFCPCCNLEVVTDKQILKYLFYICGKNKDSVVKDMKQKYGTYEKMLKEIKK